MSRLIHLIMLGAIFTGAVAPRDTRAQLSTDTLSTPRNQVAAVTAGGKVYFAGGNGASGTSDVVDIYDTATGTWSQDFLSQPRTQIAATAVGDYVLFAGGVLTNVSSSAVIDILHTQTMTWSTFALSQARATAATTVGNRALFGGGYGGGPAAPVSSERVDVYDADLGAPDDPAAWSTVSLSLARGNLSAATAGDHALFAGGRDDVLTGGLHEYTRVDIYDASVGPPSDPLAWSTSDLFQPRAAMGAASAGTRACFGGGNYQNLTSDVVDVYDSQTGNWTVTAMPGPRGTLAATAIGDTVFFAGGYQIGGVPAPYVDVLDAATLTWIDDFDLSEARGSMGAASAGDQAFFGGGFGFGGLTDRVDVYGPTWTNLGGGTFGFAGEPGLAASGSLIGGTVAALHLTDTTPGALTVAWVSFAPTPFAALGGTVHAFPFNSQLLFVTDGAGAFSGATVWPLGVPAGTQVWFQFLVQDASVAPGITLSNGLLATAP